MDIDEDSNTPLSCQEIDDFIGKLEEEADVEDENKKEEDEDDIEPSLWYSDTALYADLDPGPLISTEESRRFAAVHRKPKELKRFSRTKYAHKLETILMKMTLFNGDYWLCLKCQFKHSSKIRVLNHVYTYHCSHLLRCSISNCSFITTSQLELQDHANTHKVKTTPAPVRNPSEIPLNDFQKLESILIEKAVFTEGDWRCKMCDFGPSRRDDVLNHIECYHPPNGFIGYKCSKCDLQQRCRFSLKSHMEISHSQNGQMSLLKPKEGVPALRNGTKEPAKNVVYVFRCKWCKKVYDERPKLHQHLKEEHGQNTKERRRFNCSFCLYHCYSVEEIKRHLSSKHPVRKQKTSTSPAQPGVHQSRNFICPICSLKFKDETSYKQHIEIVEGFRFSCSLCGSLFLDEETLNFHTIYSEECSIQQEGSKDINRLSMISRKTFPSISSQQPQILPKADLTLEETCSSLIDILHNVPDQEDQVLVPSDRESPGEPNMKRLKLDGDGGSEALGDGNAQLSSNLITEIEKSQNVSNSNGVVTLPVQFHPLPIPLPVASDQLVNVAKTKIMNPLKSILKPKQEPIQSVKEEETEQTWFSCKKCQERFSQKQDLGKHLLTHLKSNPAPEAPPVTAEQDDPSATDSVPVNDQTTDGEFPCQMCQQTFAEKSDLGQHLLSHLKDGLKCLSCPAVFHNLQDAREHKKLHEASEPQHDDLNLAL